MVFTRLQEQVQQNLHTNRISAAGDGAAAGTKVIYKAYHVIKDVPVPANSTLKIVSGQKIILNSNDKLYAYASHANVDVIAEYYKRYHNVIYRSTV